MKRGDDARTLATPPGRGILVAVALVSVALTPGCLPPPSADGSRQQLEDARQRVAEVEEANRLLRITVDEQTERIRALQGLSDRRSADIVHVESVELGRYTGGWDTDGKGGDDGVKIFLVPRDAAGDAIKATGEVRIQVFDLSQPHSRITILDTTYPAEKVAEAWAGGFLAYHFSFFCPWPEGPPEADKVTVRVEFLDYFTGKRFTEQKLCSVKLP